MHKHQYNQAQVTVLDDARGVITGPMWARDEIARGNGSALARSLHLGMFAVLLVLMAYLAAAWLDEACSADVDCVDLVAPNSRGVA
jgi:hypothetical protein